MGSLKRGLGHGVFGFIGFWASGGGWVSRCLGSKWRSPAFLREEPSCLKGFIIRTLRGYGGGGVGGLNTCNKDLVRPISGSVVLPYEFRDRAVAGWSDDA